MTQDLFPGVCVSEVSAPEASFLGGAGAESQASGMKDCGAWDCC